MEEKDVTISIINNNPGLVIRANNNDEYTESLRWAIPAFKALRKVYLEYLKEEVTPQNDVVAHANQAASSYPPCKSCGGEQVYNPKTGKIFCKSKCWLT